ncbi:MAG: DUF2924 domain-containing protein [Acidobacteria bacterium]|nr:DUF2924 domain-containing protein [Acidobacteriota bacterium]MBA3845082.1 DUF2924 domain-containing protein [Planctomycetota bacterium]
MRVQWRALFGTEPPGYGRDMMRRRLAYRIQEIAYGKLAEATRQRLREIDERMSRKRPMDPCIPVAGSVLIKEHAGERHEVTVREDGFDYRGQRYDSLSSIAKRITGTNWNGPRFFGLRSTRGKAA